MRNRIIALAAVALGAFACVQAAQNGASADRVPAPGVHGFDFLMGEWLVHHRVRRASGIDQWSEFDGTCTNRALMNGSANVEEHRFNRPQGVTYGVAVRAYDAKVDSWAIWWIDSRSPFNNLDPPMKGSFDGKGVGTFYADDMLDGKPIRVRFIWSGITLSSARWEQAYSGDGGKTWETNWIMEFRRVA